MSDEQDECRSNDLRRNSPAQFRRNGTDCLTRLVRLIKLEWHEHRGTPVKGALQCLMNAPPFLGGALHL